MTEKAKPKISTALLTDVGRVRSNNEDAVAEDRDLGLMVLADGMGGYNAGEIASRITVEIVVDTVRRHWRTIPHGQIDRDTGYSYEALMLRDAVETAHMTIYQVAQSQPQCAGMGTTVVACLLHNARMSIAYVGDSRLYRLRNGILEQITRDHSLLEELIAKGHYTREEAGRLVRRNIVTRALGVEPEVAVDIIEETATVDDMVLICSDGLSDMLDEETIRRVLMDYATDPQEAARRLVALANQAGGKDNVSVNVARINEPLTSGKGWVGRFMEWF